MVEAEVGVSAAGSVEEQSTEQPHLESGGQKPWDQAHMGKVIGVEDNLATRQTGFPGEEGSHQSDKFPECDVESAVTRIPSP